MGQRMRLIGGVVHGTHVEVEGRYYLVPVPNTHNQMYMSEMDMPKIWEPYPYRTEQYERKKIYIPMRGKGLPWTYVEEVLTPTWMSDESTAAAIKELGYLFENEKVRTL